jgi:hypothetical protein
MDVDTLFKMFLNNYLIIFYTSFPLKKVSERGNKNHWITPGIRISCNRKKHLYLSGRDSNDTNLKGQYIIIRLLTLLIKWKQPGIL